MRISDWSSDVCSSDLDSGLDKATQVLRGSMASVSESRIPNPESRLHADKILILDFGAQYTQLIARRIRELGVYCEVWAWDHDPDEIATFAPKGIILSGGPESTTVQDRKSTRLNSSH